MICDNMEGWRFTSAIFGYVCMRGCFYKVKYFVALENTLFVLLPQKILLHFMFMNQSVKCYGN